MSLIPEEIIIRAIQNTADSEELEILNKWLQEDTKNVEYYFQMEEIWLSKNYPNAELLQNEWEKLSSDIEKLPHNKIPFTQPKRRASMWLRYIAAVFLGALLVSSAWMLFYYTNGINEQDHIVQNVIYNRSGVQLALLPDSSHVWINENSKLSYPEKFNNKIRLVSLEGKAYFNIQKNTEKPFIVSIGNAEIEVTGTEFFVESFPGQKSLITLISGSINLNYTNKSAQKVSLPLTPGQQASLDVITGDLHVMETETYYYQAWKDGIYRFTNEPLEKIMNQLASRFDLDIRISPSLKNRRFTGRVSSDDEIEDFLKTISQSYPVKYRITGKIIKISEN